MHKHRTNKFIERRAYVKKLLHLLGVKYCKTMVFWDPNANNGHGEEFEM